MIPVDRDKDFNPAIEKLEKKIGEIEGTLEEMQKELLKRIEGLQRTAQPTKSNQAKPK
ncbi:MAG: hypothetical protein GYA55_12005 [SAR324 cluster bacterium]|uniref:Uncharacterized protein n=1 Tax=SAR324 cluster bacterium TaxID=2024889 RepID=A0A7X9FTH9_9DELT|nr:hypothetical protein [SAR324 cluster bacterium]